MSVLDPERRVAPRSVRRYQPLPDEDRPLSQPGTLIARTSRSRPDVRTPSAPARPDDLEEEEFPRKRAGTPVPRRGPAARARTRRRIHPLFFVGVGLLIMLFGWIALNALGSWWQTTQDDWHYGRPRTFQVNAVVGHHDSAQNPSHFIAMNLNRQIIVIEIPGGDVAHAIVYRGPVLLGPGQDLTPVTLTFQDTPHDGKPNMTMHIDGEQLTWLNINGVFVPPTQNPGGTS